jgi:hypothetical protein
MFELPWHTLHHCSIQLFAKAAGVYSSNPGSGAPPEGFGSIFIFSLLGAFCGLLAGFLLAQILRYISFLAGRNLGGYSWVLVGALAGAVAFGLIEFFNQED